MAYTVIITDAQGQGISFNGPIRNSNHAIGIARAQAKECAEGEHVYIAYQNAQGAMSYLNPDGNHSPTGKPWS